MRLINLIEARGSSRVQKSPRVKNTTKRNSRKRRYKAAGVRSTKTHSVHQLSVETKLRLPKSVSAEVYVSL